MKTWGMVSGLGWGEEICSSCDMQVTAVQLPVEGIQVRNWQLVEWKLCPWTSSHNLHYADFHSYSDSPFGKPRRTVHFSSVRCVGSELRITDCPTTNYTYEQGKLLAGHLAVAGVACKQYCPISTPLPVELTTTQYVTSECPAATTQFTTTTCPSATTEYQVKTVTACPRTIDFSPTQQAQPVSVTDNSQQTVTTILLTGLTAIFGTATVTLAVW